MKRAIQHHFRFSLTSSVRARLTLWYLVMVAFIVCLFGVSLYITQISLNADTAERAAQLYQDSQRFAETYRQVLLDRQAPTTLHLKLSSQEIVLLLHPDGNALDSRGPLTDSLIQQLQTGAEQNKGMIDLTVRRSLPWWTINTTYHVLVTPVLNQNTRVAILLVGLPPPHPTPLGIIWFFHGLLALLVAAIGGYWLAGKVLRPVKMITRMANEINATDLRRRLHLQRRDEFGELAATFDHMLARLEAAFKRQTQFTADASHELRTPLTIIDLKINQALTQLEQPEEYRQAFEQIQAENAHMAAIINSLLLLARADTGQIALNLQEVDLGDLALACVERLLPLARASQIVLTTGDLPEVLIRGDSHYLGQMLTNLIENGIKYSRHIGKRVHVEVACEPPLWSVVRVQDDGPGVTDEHLPYLFSRFYRVDKARSSRQKGSTRSTLPDQEKPGGTGLGLSIVQWIVQAHHGEIRVESKIGTGSRFEIRLPLL
ncbi:sensor histidine kinase [Ktedonobacter robiniae]|uniref:histidine kinase n=1 Tax=Ktedonobacter robiniae TaxID=2778365 RepID=A0ABQ3V6W6_9CHLR|nr:HAMP domain-containing sensor histidine kinase [Ktedonobacter robiniae]GHO60585.1 two-component sensor histidine kinase [Ktedonobacter robiniae]